tara:strand:- start:11029 stop:11727 length:699 start_codon:yes stop_codon:yes gene_type:complete
MVERRISKSKYIIALVLTLAVFIIGILIGVLVSEERTKFLEQITKEQGIDFDSLQLQYFYLNTFSDQNCDAVNKALEENINRLEQTRSKLESYIAQSITNEDDFLLTKREYMLSEIRYWLLTLQTKEQCNSDVVSLLYFYSDEEECEDCYLQGTVLTFLKSKFKDRLFIFSLDSDFEREPMLGIFKENYQVTSVPTIIIKDKKLEGFVDKDVLGELICSYLENKPEVCNNEL